MDEGRRLVIGKMNKATRLIVWIIRIKKKREPDDSRT